MVSGVWSGKCCLWLPEFLWVAWHVAERRASGPSQVKGRHWGIFPDGSRALWVNSGHVEGTAQRGLKLGWGFCVSGTQTTTNFQFMIISVCIYLHSCLVHKCFSWRRFPKHVDYVRLLLCSCCLFLQLWPSFLKQFKHPNPSWPAVLTIFEAQKMIARIFDIVPISNCNQGKALGVARINKTQS